MKKITFLILTLLGTFFIGHSQCTTITGGQWPNTGTITVQNDGSAETISTNNWPNAEFTPIQGLIIGNTYTITGTNTTSIFITVAESPADFSAIGTIITSGPSSVNFTATTSTILVFWHLNATCATQASDNTLTTIQCTDPSCVCLETAAPSAATVVEPANGATNIPIDYSDPGNLLITPFSWTDGTLGGSVVSTDLSLGETPAGNDIGTLTDATNGAGIIFTWQPNTTYYWFVTSNNCFGSTDSSIWSFTTAACTSAAPTASSVISPANGATGVEINFGTTNNINPFEFTEAGTGADGFTISIGETPTGDDIGTIADFDSGGGINFNWQPNTTYYWFITGNNCAGGTNSPVWSFTTEACTATAPPASVNTPVPADNATGVMLNANGNSLTFNWAGSDPDANYTLYLDTVNPPVQSFDNFQSGDPITGLDINTTYYWRVDPINCFGLGLGNNWTFTTDSQLSISESELAGTFSVSPNPTNGILNIRYSKDVENVIVYNLLGQSVAEFNENTIKDNSVDISDLSNGLYLVRITSEGNTQTLRVNKK